MATKAYPRATRVAQQIQRTLSELIRRELRDPRLGMITLTDVRMANDLSYAKVYYSVLGADPRLAGEILAQAADLLRGPLGRSLGLRHSPQLRFVQDELIERGARLSGLINQAVKSDVARHVDEPAPAAEHADGQAAEQLDDQADGHYNSDDDDSQDSGGHPSEPKR